MKLLLRGLTLISPFFLLLLSKIVQQRNPKQILILSPKLILKPMKHPTLLMRLTPTKEANPDVDTHQEYKHSASDQALSPQEADLKELISTISNLSHKMGMTPQSSSINKLSEFQFPK
ncbi:hypothetical protein S245_066179 [Arachis hypogaea]